jgi:hypothetical protein
MSYGPVTKFFRVGAYMQAGSKAWLSSADTFLPYYTPTGFEPGIILNVRDELLAGQLAAVDCGEWYGLGAAPTIVSGMTLRAATDDERKLLAERVSHEHVNTHCWISSSR